MLSIDSLHCRTTGCLQFTHILICNQRILVQDDHAQFYMALDRMHSCIDHDHIVVSLKIFYTGTSHVTVHACGSQQNFLHLCVGLPGLVLVLHKDIEQGPYNSS